MVAKKSVISALEENEEEELMRSAWRRAEAESINQHQ
jgi:hypothetical protein